MKTKIYLSIIFAASTLFAFSQDESIVLGSEVVANAGYGNSVSMNKQSCAVGSSKAGNGTNTNSGKVFILSHTNNVWTENQIIQAPTPQDNQEFGYAVALEDTILVVGVPFDDEMGTDAGAIYIYTHNGSEFVFSTKLFASINNNAGDEYGFSVAIDNGKIIVGAPKDNEKGNDSGCAYIVENVSGTWQNTHKIVSHVGELGEEYFGYDVDIDANNVIIGAPKDDDNGTDSGAGFIFAFDGTNWSIAEKLTASDGTNADSYGFSVGISEENAVLGAYGAGSIISQGQAYTYNFDGTNWTNEQILVGDSNTPEDWFGYDVAIEKETIVISELHDDGFISNGGSAYIFRLKNGTWIDELTLSASDGHINQEFGFAVAIDSLDVLIGTIESNISGTASGRVYHYPLCTYVPEQNACMISASENSNSVELVWNTNPSTFIDSLLIFNSSDVTINSIDPELTNQFTAVGADPNFAPHSYGIKAVNVCGLEQQNSILHTTVHLTTSFNTSSKAVLNWTDYAGYDVNFYRIYRDDLNDGNFQLVNAVIPGITTYTDNSTPNTNEVAYRIEAFKTGLTCNGNNVASNSISNSSRPLLSISEEKPTIELMSNLVQSNLEILGLNQFDYEIYSLTGQVVMKGKSSGLIDIEKLPVSQYVLKIGQFSRNFYKY